MLQLCTAGTRDAPLTLPSMLQLDIAGTLDVPSTDPWAIERLERPQCKAFPQAIATTMVAILQWWQYFQGSSYS